MTSDRSGARLLYIVLALLTGMALVGLGGLYRYVFDAADTKSFNVEIGKGLVQVFTLAVIGSLVKLLIDEHQRRLREMSEARVRAEQDAAQNQIRAEQQEERLEAFRADKVRRLVGVTNVLRRAPILIDAHRSAKTYNEQMREIVNAGLELRLIRHEIDALGATRNAAFSDWPEVRGSIRRMEEYVGTIVSDFRARSKELSELQRRAESDRALQPQVWQGIASIESLRDLLQDAETAGQTTRYGTEYLAPYQEALRLMIGSSLGLAPSRASGGAAG